MTFEHIVWNTIISVLTSGDFFSAVAFRDCFFRGMSLLFMNKLYAFSRMEATWIDLFHLILPTNCHVWFKMNNCSLILQDLTSVLITRMWGIFELDLVARLAEQMRCKCLGSSPAEIRRFGDRVVSHLLVQFSSLHDLRGIVCSVWQRKEMNALFLRDSIMKHLPWAPTTL